MRKILKSIILGGALSFGIIMLSYKTLFAAAPTLIEIKELATAPTTPATAAGYIYALSSDSKLYYKSDAGTAYDMTSGTAAWDDISDPDANNEIDFADYISEMKLGSSGDFRIGDGGDNYVKFGNLGTMTWHGTADIDLKDDCVDDADINWGSGANQVDTDDITEGSTNKFDTGFPDEMVTYSACSLLVPMASDPVTTAAPNDYVNCNANIQIPCVNFDDSTEWARNWIVPVHEDFDNTSTISFEVHGMPYTAPATAKNVKFKVYWLAIGSEDLYTGSTASSETADIAVSTTQASGDVLIFGINNITLGWAARDTVYGQISRIDADADDLTGHYQMTNFIIYLKRS